MKTETLTTIRSILVADTSTTPKEIERALKAIQSSPQKREMGTKKQAAEILSVHPQSITRYVNRSLLHPVYITARRVRYDLAEVRKLAEFGAQAVQDAESNLTALNA